MAKGIKQQKRLDRRVKEFDKHGATPNNSTAFKKPGSNNK